MKSGKDLFQGIFIGSLRVLDDVRRGLTQDHEILGFIDSVVTGQLLSEVVEPDSGGISLCGVPCGFGEFCLDDSPNRLPVWMAETFTEVKVWGDFGK